MGNIFQKKKIFEVKRENITPKTEEKPLELPKIKEEVKELPQIKEVKHRTPKRLPIAIDESEFTELIKHTRKKSHKLAFLLGFGSGMRISEIINLQPRHVNLKEKNILVERGKGGKDRVIPVPKSFKEEYLKLLPLKFKNISSGSRSLEQAFKKAAKKAGLLEKKPRLHFHNLRSGFVTNCISKGIPLNYIMALVGHANISTTSVYVALNPVEALKSYQDLF